MLFATNNPNKLSELQEIFNDNTIQSLKDVNIDIDVPETGKTFYQNALIKANR